MFVEPARLSIGTWTRRDLLQIGALGIPGLSLTEASALRAAQPQAAASHLGSPPLRSCILLFFYGGPCQLDTWDMKPLAPAEVRGEFRSTATTVPGLRISEHLPRMARVMHHAAIIRSLHHPMRNHNSAAVEALCGRTPLKGDLELLSDDPNSFPNYGSCLSRVRPGGKEMPGHVALPHLMYNVVVLPGQTAGFLGAAHEHFQVVDDPSQPGFGVSGLSLPADIPLARLADRKSLLALVDAQIAGRERSQSSGTMSAFQQTALDLIRSDRVRLAFDIGREAPPTRARYGQNKLGQSLLLARRLVEAGVSFINVNDGVHNGQVANWDSHENNFGRLKNDLLPPADMALSALIEDLAARGLLDTTLIVAMGEFGRTPRINKSSGRDHWPDCYSCLLAGGGVRGGTTFGASDKLGAYPDLDGVTPGDLAATLFWRFGLDAELEIHDLIGRPYRLAEGQPLYRLFTAASRPA